MSDNAKSSHFRLNFGDGVINALTQIGILDDDKMAVIENSPLDKYFFPRMDVAEFMHQSILNGTWQRKFHMSLEAFDNLIDIICDDVGVNKWHSKFGSGGNNPITPEMSVMMGLNFVGGEIRKTIEDFDGVLPMSCERHCFRFLDVVDGCSDPPSFY